MQVIPRHGWDPNQKASQVRHEDSAAHQCGHVQRKKIRCEQRVLMLLGHTERHGEDHVLGSPLTAIVGGNGGAATPPNVLVVRIHCDPRLARGNSVAHHRIDQGRASHICWSVTDPLSSPHQWYIASGQCRSVRCPRHAHQKIHQQWLTPTPTPRWSQDVTRNHWRAISQLNRHRDHFHHRQ